MDAVSIGQSVRVASRAADPKGWPGHDKRIGKVEKSWLALADHGRGEVLNVQVRFGEKNPDNPGEGLETHALSDLEAA